MEKVHKTKRNVIIFVVFAVVVFTVPSVIAYNPQALSQTSGNDQLPSNMTTGNETSTNTNMSATDSSMTGDDESPTEGSGI